MSYAKPHPQPAFGFVLTEPQENPARGSLLNGAGPVASPRPKPAREPFRLPFKTPFKGRFLPPAFIAILLSLGAGAATGLILDDSVEGVTGNTTVGVSQTLTLTNLSAFGDNDNFIGVIDDDGLNFSVHLLANNGDKTGFSVTVANVGGSGAVAFRLVIHSGSAPFTFSVTGDDDPGNDTDGDGTLEQVVPTALDTWVSVVGANSTNTLDITIAISDGGPVGFYEVGYEIQPVNV